YTTAGTEFPNATSLKALDVTLRTIATASKCESSDENVAEPAPADPAEVAQQHVDAAPLTVEQPPAEEPVVEQQPEQSPAEEILPTAPEQLATGEELAPEDEATVPAE